MAQPRLAMDRRRCLLRGFVAGRFELVAHLSLTMNTHLRVPLFDPLLVCLAAGAVSRFFGRSAPNLKTVNLE